MQSYLEEIVDRIIGEHHDLQELVFVLPSNRAVRLTQKIISNSLQKPCFAPKIINVESFVQELSNIEIADEFEIVLELYKLHQKHNSIKGEDFAGFQSWGNSLIGDFNEIDRYLIPPQKIFDHLTAISKLNEWIKNTEPTDVISSYIKFSKNLLPIYEELNEVLINRGLGYQGMIYKKAVENLPNYLKNNSRKKHFFIGLNALNGAEKHIIKTLLIETDSNSFWDIDPYFLQDKLHDAGFFIRQHLEQWRSVTHKMHFSEKSCYLEPKNIKIASISKNHSQIKFIGQLITQIDFQQQKTALVLADESLLPILLNSLTIPLSEVNVTMGYPLEKTNIASFAISLLQIKSLATENGWFHKDLINLLTHPTAPLFFEKDDIDSFITHIKSNNLSFVPKSIFKFYFSSANAILTPFFINDGNSTQLIEDLKDLLADILNTNSLNTQVLEIEASALLYNILQQASNHITGHSFLQDAKSLIRFLESLIEKETITFKGNPDKGLQVMGVLETRGMDFDTIIMTSLNEGVLPAGKTTGSFIPFDVKREFNLPTTKEKDAVYAYHFYRLIQRTKNIYLIYNSDADVLSSSEKSRFIYQIETDPNLKPYIENITASTLTPSIQSKFKTVTKTESLLTSLRAYAENGFSPSSLSTYIKNPYLFYKRHILKIDDAVIVDDEIAHNVFGTIVHDTLESIYTPFVNDILNPKELEKIKTSVAEKVMQQFEKHYPKNAITQGKNLIVYNVIQRYVASVVDFDIEAAKKHELKIIALEQKLSMRLQHPSGEFMGILKGKLDRIDEIDGKLRILDYKTGKVEQSKLKIDSTEQLLSNEKYDKFFQLMCYTLMVKSQLGKKVNEAAIIPIKSMKDAPSRVFFKESKTHQISDKALYQFKQGLINLVEQILDSSIPFKEPQ